MLCISCEKGPQGEPGRDGNGNVETYFIQVDDTDWLYSNYAAVFPYSLPEITSEIIEYGAISCYMEKVPGVWSALPYSEVSGATGNELITTYTISEGEILVATYYDDHTTISNIPSCTFKVVIISGK